MKKLSARRIATTAAVTLGLLGAAAAVPAAAFAADSAPGRPPTGNNALLAAINDARLHPEKYTPHGDATGAKMTGCATPLTASSKLYKRAHEHDAFLATQTLDWLTAGDGKNPHRDADGILAGADNGRIASAGYLSRRAEIVAWGQTNSVAAVRAWMQDDAGSNWGHRNIILDCDLIYAGASHFTGGPAGDYYTADMGNP